MSEPQYIGSYGALAKEFGIVIPPPLDVNTTPVNVRRAQCCLPPIPFGEYPEPIYLQKLKEQSDGEATAAAPIGGPA